MKWSRYSRLFKSKRNGWLLFSSVSNTFLKVSDEEAKVLMQIKEDPEDFDFSELPMLYMQLRSSNILVEDGRDEDTFNVIKMQRLSNLYADRSLLLTVAVTTSCNFDCPYCFEASHRGKIMDEAAEDLLIAFIKKYRGDVIHLTWYGGEPLLAWERILSVNKRLGDIGRRYDAGMITNGYLLTPDKAKRLNELKIGYLQITLDGTKETHNARRYLAGGGPTYDKILENIDHVMRSDFKGRLHIRVNVDGTNDEEFADVYRMIQQKYPKDFGKRISVYPGFVHESEHHGDTGCLFDTTEQGAFVARMMEKYGIAPMRLYPQRQATGCVLTKRNGYVIGPEAEVYKCWDDVGDKTKAVGSLARFDNWDMARIAEGTTGCCYLDDPECKECFYFPICNGGCHRVRQNNLHREEKQSSCTYFKGNIEALLEHFYEERMKMQARKIAAQQKQKSAQQKKDAAANG